MAGENVVQVVIDGKDDLGPAFTSATAREKVFADAMEASAKRSAAAQQKASDQIQQARFKQVSAASKLLDAERMIDAEAEKATRIQADLNSVLHGGSTEAERLAASAENAGGSMGALAMPGGGIGLLIGAGVALAPVLATVGFGLGGLGLAAAGIIEPIVKASQATGGLQANMGKLDPAQQAAARSLLGLEDTYKGFEAALAPTVLKDFNAAIGAARPLLAGVQPVALATGKALEGVFQQVGATFRSGQWQQFFQFMAQQAGPDIKMLGTDFAAFAQGLPGLVEDLKPVSDSLMGILTDVTQLTAVLGTTSQALGKAGQSAGGGTNGFGKLLDSLKQLGPALMTGGVSVAVQHLRDMGTAGATAARSTQLQVDAATALAQRTGDLIHPLGAAATGSGVLAHHATEAASAERAMAAGVSATTGALVKGLGPLQNYIGSTITQKNDEAALKTALQASGDRIGYKTQKERDSFSIAQTYIKDTLTQAQAAITSKKGVDQQISSLQTAIGVLQNVKGKTSDYRAELQLLKTMLDRLRAEKDITKYVTVITRDVVQGASRGSGKLVGGQEFHAAGGIIGAAGGGPRGGMTWVGEQGPELVSLPLGSTVYPSGQSRAMAARGGGGGDTYNVHVQVSPGTAPAETGRQIAYYLGEFKKRGGKIYAPAGY